MVRYLAIDPGGNTGFAFGEPGSKPFSGVYKVPTGHSLGYRFVALQRFAMELIKHNRIDALFYEEPFLGTFGDMQKSFRAETLRWGYTAHLASAAELAGLSDVQPVAITTWRSLAGVPTQAPKTIKGSELRRKWLKQQSMLRCEKLGYPVKSHDEADAALIWHAMCLAFLEKEASPGLFDHVRL